MSARRSWSVAIVLALAVVLSGCVRGDLAYLAADASDGRNNNTAGSQRAQNYLLDYMTRWTDGANSQATGVDAYKQPFDLGTNLVGVIPGTDLADEYVMIGAHYDHVGHGCRDLRAGDDICNGATDNAAAVAAVLQVIALVRLRAGRRRAGRSSWRSGIGRKTGCSGSRYYTQHPLIPLADTVAYVNLDIQGANLRPSLRNFSFAVGAESGGTRLKEIVQNAIDPSPLGTRELSVVFGQGRSDHVNFVSAGVPTVFFSDATGPCYHTDSDDLAVVDYGKLDAQIAIVHRTMQTLVATERAADVHADRDPSGDLCRRVGAPRRDQRLASRPRPVPTRDRDAARRLPDGVEHDRRRRSRRVRQRPRSAGCSRSRWRPSGSSPKVHATASSPRRPILPRSSGRAWVYTGSLPALVAQWIEHLTTDQKVGGSSPSERAEEVQVSAPCNCTHQVHFAGRLRTVATKRVRRGSSERESVLHVRS